MADDVLVKRSELKDKSDEDLAELLKTTTRALFTARFENHTNKLNDTATIGKLRRQLARIHTMVSRRKRKNEGKASHG